MRRSSAGDAAEAAARTAVAELGWGPVRLRVVRCFFERLLGMHLVRDGDGDGDALPCVLAFPRCRSVHTCIMRRPLDIAFIDGAGCVLALHERVGPGRFLSCPGASLVLERLSPPP